MRGHQVRPYGSSVTTNDQPTQPPSRGEPTERSGIPVYEIRVAGRLGTRWAAWFDGLDLTTEDDGTTVMRGPVVDQAALHGLLHKLRDLGLPLVSLTPLPPDVAAASTAVGPHPVLHHPTGATT
jgi:hypothetical protein